MSAQYYLTLTTLCINASQIRYILKDADSNYVIYLIGNDEKRISVHSAADCQIIEDFIKYRRRMQTDILSIPIPTFGTATSFYGQR
jgi:hypothetical protein